MEALPLFISSVTVFAAQTLATTATSSVVEVKESEWITLQVIAAGASISGTVQPQGSCDGVNYSNIGSVINLATTPTAIQNLPQGAYSDVRLAYTTASGTGTLTAIINQKR